MLPTERHLRRAPLPSPLRARHAWVPSNGRPSHCLPLSPCGQAAKWRSLKPTYSYVRTCSMLGFFSQSEQHAVKTFPRKQCAHTRSLAAVARKIADKNLEQDRQEDGIIIERGSGRSSSVFVTHEGRGSTNGKVLLGSTKNAPLKAIFLPIYLGHSHFEVYQLYTNQFTFLRCC